MVRRPTDISLAAWIRQLIEEDKLYLFYKSIEWNELRDSVMRDSHYECQHCLGAGKYKRAEMVHHINEVRKRPELALTREYVDARTNEKIVNLIALCNPCHERVHDRAGTARKANGKCGFSNTERW